MRKNPFFWLEMVKIIVTAFFSQYINLILLLLLLLFTWNTSFNFHITKFHDPESNSGVCVCVVINFFVQLYIDLSTFWSYIDHDETIYLNDRNIILLGTHSIRLIDFFCKVIIIIVLISAESFKKNFSSTYILFLI